ncbi:MAG: DegT/DnrJ/EryC1/StrS family aminotransferase [Deltaproteobacteria bacterium]|nr:DegT/DnrJ/EryC1/StrS family aminotransferase [Deltaproteobacteria bacterium]
MFSPLRLDASWKDFFWGYVWASLPRSWSALSSPLEGWGDNHQRVELLSVRTGFDLALKALHFPPGSEILMTAVNIADMGKIIEANGLVPVPVDVDPGTLLPDVDALEAKISPRTKALLAAHLFGSWNNLDPLAELCKRRGLLFFEDLAQCFLGKGFTGHPQATLSFFSFGAIKRATALGGGVAFVRDPELRAAILRLESDYPWQPASQYRQKLRKYFFVHVISKRPMYWLLVRVAPFIGISHEKMMRGLVKGFPDPASLLRMIRQRAHPAIFRLLARKVNHFRPELLEDHKARIERLLTSINGRYTVLGNRAAKHTFWLLPLVCEDPENMLAHLRRQGFDATRATTSLQVIVPQGGGRPEQIAPQAAWMMSHVVYVPFYPQTPLEHLIRVLAPEKPGLQPRTAEPIIR